MKLVYLLSSIYGVSATEKLGHLVMATRVKRGRMPDTLETRTATIERTIGALDHPYAELKTAMRTRMLASYKCACLLRPLIHIFGQVTASLLSGSTLPASIGRRFTCAIKDISTKLMPLLRTVKSAYVTFDGFDKVEERSVSMLKAAADAIDKLRTTMEALVKKPSLQRASKARASLLLPSMRDFLSEVGEMEYRALVSSVNELTPKKQLQSSLSFLVSDGATSELKLWATRYLYRQALAELQLGQASLKLPRVSNLGCLIGSNLFACILRDDYMHQALPNSGYSWTSEIFPNDGSLAHGIGESWASVQEKVQSFTQDLDKLIEYNNKMFIGAFTLTDEDMVEIPIQAKATEESYKRLEIAEIKETRSRMDFVNTGLYYLQ